MSAMFSTGRILRDDAHDTTLERAERVACEGEVGKAPRRS